MLVFFYPNNNAYKSWQDRLPQVAHIPVEPTKLPSVSGGTSQAAPAEEPVIKELAVSVRQEEEVQPTPKPKLGSLRSSSAFKSIQ